MRFSHSTLEANILNRAIKMNLANEGLEARKKDEEVAQRKRKAEDDKSWEGMSNLTVIRSKVS